MVSDLHQSRRYKAAQRTACQQLNSSGLHQIDSQPLEIDVGIVPRDECAAKLLIPVSFARKVGV